MRPPGSISSTSRCGEQTGEWAGSLWEANGASTSPSPRELCDGLGQQQLSAGTATQAVMWQCDGDADVAQKYFSKAQYQHRATPAVVALAQAIER